MDEDDALGVDAINVGREAMMAIGCIQAQRCHTDHCVLALSRACGVPHPVLITADQLELLDGRFGKHQRGTLWIRSGLVSTITLRRAWSNEDTTTHSKKH